MTIRNVSRFTAEYKMRRGGAGGKPVEFSVQSYGISLLNAADAAAARVLLEAAEEGAVSAHNDLTSKQGGTTGEYYHLTSAELTSLGNMVTAGVDSLTADEVTQLGNIGSNAISGTEWGYLAALDQSLAQATTPTFANVISGAPTLSTHLVTKEYADALINGLKIKNVNVKCRTTANINLSNALIDGATFDGVTVATGDVVFVASQTSAIENGLYTVVASGAASRHAVMNSSSEFVSAFFFINEGTLYADYEYRITVNDSFVMGTDNVTFIEKASVTNHATLSNKQGGTTGEYYHLTNAQLTNLDSMITAGVQGLTSDEVTQLANIGSNAISATQWGYLAAFNQALTTTSNVSFSNVTSSGRIDYGVTVKNITSNEQLTSTSKSYQYLDPTTGNRDVIMPLLSSVPLGATYTIVHNGAANEMQLKRHSTDDGTDIGAFTIDAGTSVTVQKISTVLWKVFQ